MIIKYSPDASKRLKRINSQCSNQISIKIFRAIRGLMDNPQKCPKIENLLNVQCPYYLLHTEHHYVFYRIDSDTILIVAIFHEKENIMTKLFDISLRTTESVDYWGE